MLALSEPLDRIGQSPEQVLLDVAQQESLFETLENAIAIETVVGCGKAAA